MQFGGSNSHCLNFDKFCGPASLNVQIFSTNKRIHDTNHSGKVSLPDLHQWHLIHFAGQWRSGTSQDKIAFIIFSKDRASTKKMGNSLFYTCNLIYYYSAIHTMQSIYQTRNKLPIKDLKCRKFLTLCILWNQPCGTSWSWSAVDKQTMRLRLPWWIQICSEVSVRAGHPSKIKELDFLVKQRQRNEAWITKQPRDRSRNVLKEFLLQELLICHKTFTFSP